MDYATIVSTALLYADRANDSEAVSAIDSMLRIVEARINRGLLVMASSLRTYVQITDESQEYYDLPDGFSSFRSVKISTAQDITAVRTTLEYATPSKLNDIRLNNLSGDWYTIEANKLQIHSDKLVLNNYIEYVNYADIIPLSSSVTTNWLSESYPDCYINGIVVELCKFAKDWDSALAYEKMFRDCLSEIDLQDDRLTWSGSQLFTQVG